jgi:hypothetical protein
MIDYPTIFLAGCHHCEKAGDCFFPNPNLALSTPHQSQNINQKTTVSMPIDR